jgi:hypothetical protein
LDVITTTGGSGALTVPSSGIVIWKSLRNSSRNALELAVRAVDLVDQQHHRPAQRAQQRALEQELLGVEIADGPPSASHARIAAAASGESHSYSACAASSPS